MLQPSLLQVVGNQRSGGRFGFQARRPNNQNKSSGSGGKPPTGDKRKSGQKIRVDQNSLGQANTLDKILSNGRYVINARDDI